ncbi:hypothetical protein BD770DRAFT_458520 [Pilaira anomala]|nr:hypothetical protein BD770DRAFT_458520 [Pilaira anomala]
MPPTNKVTNTSLVDDIASQYQDIIPLFTQTKKQLICTKCTSVGTISYVENTMTEPITPIFECTACKANYPVSEFEFELERAKVQRSSITTNNTKIFKNFPPAANVAPPTSSATFIIPDKQVYFGDIQSNFTASKKPAAPKVVTGKKRVRRTSDAANNTPTTSATDDLRIENQLLKAQLLRANTEITALKEQQHIAATKYAALDQTKLELEKKLTFFQLDQQTKHHTLVTEDSEMNLDDDTSTSQLAATSETNNNQQQQHIPTKGSASSKWADVASTNLPPRAPAAPPKYPNKNSSNNTKKNKIPNNQKKNNNNNTNTTHTTKITSPPKQKVVTQNKLDNAVRAFSAPSTEKQGFSYVYYPVKSRISRKIQRSNLHALGVTNSRILDIHYPSRNVVALLVHNDYQDELINKLKSKGVNN